MNKLSDIAGYDREYGRHSNIPECCVEFYVTEFIPHILFSPRRFNAHDRLQNDTERRLGKEWEYRPCLNCMRTGHWHRLHKCDGLLCDGLSGELRAKYHLGRCHG